MKRQVLRMLSLSMALVLMGSFSPLNVSAQEYKAEGDSAIDGIEINFADICNVNEDFTIGDMAFSFPESDSMEIDLATTVERFKTGGTSNVIPLYTAGGVQAYATGNEASRESTLKYGTVSGYLSETGAYALYNLNLAAGDYLQARLTVPNNVSIDYALVFFDSELNILKLSDYASCLNGGLALEESVGYLCASDEMIYIGVLSISGGSETEAFTLDFSVTTNFSENGEPNENVPEAVALTLGNAGTTVSGTLNSPVDNDWYSFAVINSDKYDKIRLSLTSSSSTNGCKMEIYKNVETENLSMQLVGSGSGEGELALEAGTYYVRIISTNALNNFNPGDIPVYNLSVVPVSKVDSIKITQLKGPKGSENCTYHEGTLYRLYDAESNWIKVTGICYSDTQFSVSATNVKINVAVYNVDTQSIRYGSGVIDSSGWFHIIVPVDPAGGKRLYENHPTSTLITYHKYDLMRVMVWPGNDESKGVAEKFYLYQKKSIIN